MKTNLIINSENKGTTNYPRVIVDMSNQKFDNFATTVAGPTTQELKKCIENFDKIADIMFAFPTNITKVFNTEGNLENDTAVGINGVSAEVLKTSLPVFIFILLEFLNLFLSRNCFSKCLMEAKVYLSHNFADIMNISNYRLILIIPTISKVFEKIMYERSYSLFDKKNMFYSKQFGFCSKLSSFDALAEITEQFRQGSTDTFASILPDLRKAFDSINHKFLLANEVVYEVGRSGRRSPDPRWAHCSASLIAFASIRCCPNSDGLFSLRTLSVKGTKSAQ